MKLCWGHGKESHEWWGRLPTLYVLLYYPPDPLWPESTSSKCLSLAKVTWLSLPIFLRTEWLDDERNIVKYTGGGTMIIWVRCGESNFIWLLSMGSVQHCMGWTYYTITQYVLCFLRICFMLGIHFGLGVGVSRQSYRHIPLSGLCIDLYLYVHVCFIYLFFHQFIKIRKEIIKPDNQVLPYTLYDDMDLSYWMNHL
jgi:hypothetical protein